MISIDSLKEILNNMKHQSELILEETPKDDTYNRGYLRGVEVTSKFIIECIELGNEVESI